MGKSGGKKKKVSVSNQTLATNNQNPNPNGELDSSIFLKRAHELKEEGNRRFQNKDYVNALEQYENALKLTPKMHPDRAVFHSNKAACLMQMKPIDYDSVIAECSLALHVQPRFARALLRRARAFEALGKYEMAMQDVQAILGPDPNHGDALETGRRLKELLGNRGGAQMEAQQDLQSRPSPAALGASAVGAAVSGLGPCLPARPVPKKGTSSAVPPNANTKLPQQVNKPVENGPKPKTQFPSVVLKPSNSNAKSNHTKDAEREPVPLPARSRIVEAPVRYRPLKFIYDHDIRLAQMPVSCKFRTLRDLVSKRFPSSKSVLIKYKDSDGDLVTITCTNELRLAESFVDSLLAKEPDTDKSDSVGMLRLHIVEVAPEQEPPIPEEEEIEEKPLTSDENSSLADSGVEHSDTDTQKPEKEAPKEEKSGALQDPEGKEVEMDDWLFEFAQLFRTHVGIDPDAHVDLHELGMELCSEALEETVTSEESQALFDKAALKFQEVAALAFFNWGNVHMCAARKRIPIDDSANKEIVEEKLQMAYDWVMDKYTLAKGKYEEALSIKPDFYEGLLALGQQQFEMAKLHWSYVIAKKEDLSKWDPAETFKLFDSAEEKMKAATEMWEKLEEQRANELKDPNMSKREELLKRRNKQEGEITTEELAEQAAVMRSQIHLFWGNMLFERSQVECKLGFDGWKEKMDSAIERFKLAGASEADISAVLKNHCSNLDVAEEKKVKTGSVADEAGDNEDKLVRAIKD